jgi:hypothetical protein
LKGTYHNKKNKGIGLINFEFHDNGLDAQWKLGIEPGTMRGKWEGSIASGEKLDNIEAESVNKVGIYLAQAGDEPEKISPLSGAEEKSSMLKIKFEHKATLVVSLKLDDTNYDPEADSDLSRKQKLTGYLKAIIYMLNELPGEIYGKDQLGNIEFILKNKGQCFNRNEV